MVGLNILELVESRLDDFERVFKNNPELFIFESEIRDSLFRMFALTFSRKGFVVEKEYCVNKNPIIKYDLAILNGKEIIFSFEIKHNLSNSQKSLNLIKKDVTRLTAYSTMNFIKGFFLYYDSMIDAKSSLVGKINRICSVDATYGDFSFRITLSHHRLDMPLISYEKRKRMFVNASIDVRKVIRKRTFNLVTTFIKKRKRVLFNHIYKLGGDKPRINYDTLLCIIKTLIEEGTIEEKNLGKLRFYEWKED